MLTDGDGGLNHASNKSVHGGTAATPIGTLPEWLSEDQYSGGSDLSAQPTTGQTTQPTTRRNKKNKRSKNKKGRRRTPKILLSKILFNVV